MLFNILWHFLTTLFRGRDPKDSQLPMQSVPISTYDVRSNPAHGELYSIQH